MASPGRSLGKSLGRPVWKSPMRPLMTVLCSAMLALASVPSVAAADVLPEIDFPEDVPRSAMPHIDSSQLVDDGSLYYDIITEANESGEPARSADYAYGAVEMDGGESSPTWVPVRESDDAGGELAYDEAWELRMDSEVDISEVHGERRRNPSSMFDPITIQVLDEDGDLLEDRVPMTPDDALDGPEADRTFRFSSGRVVSIPSRRYTLRIIESRPQGDVAQDVTFLIGEGKELVVEGSGDGDFEVVGDGRSDATDRQAMCRRDYPSGAVFTAEVWIAPVDVRYRHTETLYDPTERNKEFEEYLAEAYPDGCTASEAEHAWTDALWNRAYKELNPTPMRTSSDRSTESEGDLENRSSTRGGGGMPTSLAVALVASVAVVLAGTVAVLVLVTRKPSRRAKGTDTQPADPEPGDGRHDAR